MSCFPILRDQTVNSELYLFRQEGTPESSPWRTALCVFPCSTGGPRPASPYGICPRKGASVMLSLGRDGAAALGFQEGVEEHGGAKARVAL